MSTNDGPSEYQLRTLRDAGCRVRPRSYGSGQDRISRLPPSAAQVELLRELGLEAPATRAAASAAITAYEVANEAWAAERRAARTAKGMATRKERVRAGMTPRYNDTLEGYHASAVDQHGPLAASKPALSYLRGLALQLPSDSEPRVATFNAMRSGLSKEQARIRIDGLKAGAAS